MDNLFDSLFPSSRNQDSWSQSLFGEGGAWQRASQHLDDRGFGLRTLTPSLETTGSEDTMDTAPEWDKSTGTILSLNVFGKRMTTDELLSFEAGRRLLELTYKNHKGRRGFVEAFTKGGLLKFVPYVNDLFTLGSTIQGTRRATDTFRRLAAGDEVSPEDLLEARLMIAESDRASNQTLWGLVGSITSQSISFATEFAFFRAGKIALTTALGVSPGQEFSRATARRVSQHHVRKALQHGGELAVEAGAAGAKTVTRVTGQEVKDALIGLQKLSADQIQKKLLADGATKQLTHNGEKLLAQLLEGSVRGTIRKAGLEAGVQVTKDALFPALAKEVATMSRLVDANFLMRFAESAAHHTARGIFGYMSPLTEVGDGMGRAFGQSLAAIYRASFPAVGMYAADEGVHAFYSAITGDDVVTRTEAELVMSGFFAPTKAEQERIMSQAKAISHGVRWLEYASENMGEALSHVVGGIKTSFSSQAVKKVSKAAGKGVTFNTDEAAASSALRRHFARFVPGKDIKAGVDETIETFAQGLWRQEVGRKAAKAGWDAVDETTKAAFREQAAKQIHIPLLGRMLLSLVEKGLDPSQLGSFLKNVGYDGVLEEMFEERINDFLQGLLGLDEAPSRGVWERIKHSFAETVAPMADPKQLAAEIISFGLPSILRMGIHNAQTQLLVGGRGEVAQLYRSLESTKNLRKGETGVIAFRESGHAEGAGPGIMVRAGGEAKGKAEAADAILSDSRAAAKQLADLGANTSQYLHGEVSWGRKALARAAQVVNSVISGDPLMAFHNPVAATALEYSPVLQSMVIQAGELRQQIVTSSDAVERKAQEAVYQEAVRELWKADMSRWHGVHMFDEADVDRIVEGIRETDDSLSKEQVREQVYDAIDALAADDALTAFNQFDRSLEFRIREDMPDTQKRVMNYLDRRRQAARFMRISEQSLALRDAMEIDSTAERDLIVRVTNEHSSDKVSTDVQELAYLWKLDPHIYNVKDGYARVRERAKQLSNLMDNMGVATTLTHRETGVMFEVTQPTEDTYTLRVLQRGMNWDDPGLVPGQIYQVNGKSELSFDEYRTFWENNYELSHAKVRVVGSRFMYADSALEFLFDSSIQDYYQALLWNSDDYINLRQFLYQERQESLFEALRNLPEAQAAALQQEAQSFLEANQGPGFFQYDVDGQGLKWVYGGGGHNTASEVAVSALAIKEHGIMTEEVLEYYLRRHYEIAGTSVLRAFATQVRQVLQEKISTIEDADSKLRHEQLLGILPTEGSRINSETFSRIATAVLFLHDSDGSSTTGLAEMAGMRETIQNLDGYAAFIMFVEEILSGRQQMFVENYEMQFPELIRFASALVSADKYQTFIDNLKLAHASLREASMQVGQGAAAADKIRPAPYYSHAYYRVMTTAAAAEAAQHERRTTRHDQETGDAIPQDAQNVVNNIIAEEEAEREKKAATDAAAKAEAVSRESETPAPVETPGKKIPVPPGVTPEQFALTLGVTVDQLEVGGTTAVTPASSAVEKPKAYSQSILSLANSPDALLVVTRVMHRLAGFTDNELIQRFKTHAPDSSASPGVRSVAALILASTGARNVYDNRMVEFLQEKIERATDYDEDRLNMTGLNYDNFGEIDYKSHEEAIRGSPLIQAINAMVRSLDTTPGAGRSFNWTANQFRMAFDALGPTTQHLMWLLDNGTPGSRIITEADVKELLAALGNAIKTPTISSFYEKYAQTVEAPPSRPGDLYLQMLYGVLQELDFESQRELLTAISSAYDASVVDLDYSYYRSQEDIDKKFPLARASRKKVGLDYKSGFIHKVNSIFMEATHQQLADTSTQVMRELLDLLSEEAKAEAGDNLMTTWLAIRSHLAQLKGRGSEVPWRGTEAGDIYWDTMAQVTDIIFRDTNNPFSRAFRDAQFHRWIQSGNRDAYGNSPPGAYKASDLQALISVGADHHSIFTKVLDDIVQQYSGFSFAVSHNYLAADAKVDTARLVMLQQSMREHLDRNKLVKNNEIDHLLRSYAEYVATPSFLAYRGDELSLITGALAGRPPIIDHLTHESRVANLLTHIQRRLEAVDSPEGWQEQLDRERESLMRYGRWADGTPLLAVLGGYKTEGADDTSPTVEKIFEIAERLYRHYQAGTKDTVHGRYIPVPLYRNDASRNLLLNLPADLISALADQYEGDRLPGSVLPAYSVLHRMTPHLLIAQSREKIMASTSMRAPLGALKIVHLNFGGGYGEVMADHDFGQPGSIAKQHIIGDYILIKATETDVREEAETDDADMRNRYRSVLEANREKGVTTIVVDNESAKMSFYSDTWYVAGVGEEIMSFGDFLETLVDQATSEKIGRDEVVAALAGKQLVGKDGYVFAAEQSPAYWEAAIPADLQVWREHDITTRESGDRGVLAYSYTEPQAHAARAASVGTSYVSKMLPLARNVHTDIEVARAEIENVLKADALADAEEAALANVAVQAALTHFHESRRVGRNQNDQVLSGLRNIQRFQSLIQQDKGLYKFDEADTAIMSQVLEAFDPELSRKLATGAIDPTDREVLKSYAHKIAAAFRKATGPIYFGSLSVDRGSFLNTVGTTMVLDENTGTFQLPYEVTNRAFTHGDDLHEYSTVFSSSELAAWREDGGVVEKMQEAGIKVKDTKRRLSLTRANTVSPMSRQGLFVNEQKLREVQLNEGLEEKLPPADDPSYLVTKLAVILKAARSASDETYGRRFMLETVMPLFQDEFGQGFVFYMDPVKTKRKGRAVLSSEYVPGSFTEPVGQLMAFDDLFDASGAFDLSAVYYGRDAKLQKSSGQRMMYLAGMPFLQVRTPSGSPSARDVARLSGGNSYTKGIDTRNFFVYSAEGLVRVSGVARGDALSDRIVMTDSGEVRSHGAGVTYIGKDHDGDKSTLLMYYYDPQTGRRPPLTMPDGQMNSLLERMNLNLAEEGVEAEISRMLSENYLPGRMGEANAQLQLMYEAAHKLDVSFHEGYGIDLQGTYDPEVHRRWFLGNEWTAPTGPVFASEEYDSIRFSGQTYSTPVTLYTTEQFNSVLSTYSHLIPQAAKMQFDRDRVAAAEEAETEYTHADMTYDDWVEYMTAGTGRTIDEVLNTVQADYELDDPLARARISDAITRAGSSRSIGVMAVRTLNNIQRNNLWGIVRPTGGDEGAPPMNHRQYELLRHWLFQIANATFDEKGDTMDRKGLSPETLVLYVGELMKRNWDSVQELQAFHDLWLSWLRSDEGQYAILVGLDSDARGRIVKEGSLERLVADGGAIRLRLSETYGVKQAETWALRQQINKKLGGYNSVWEDMRNFDKVIEAPRQTIKDLYGMLQQEEAKAAVSEIHTAYKNSNSYGKDHPVTKKIGEILAQAESTLALNRALYGSMVNEDLLDHYAALSTLLNDQEALTRALSNMSPGERRNILTPKRNLERRLYAAADAAAGWSMLTQTALDLLMRFPSNSTTTGVTLVESIVQAYNAHPELGTHPLFSMLSAWQERTSETDSTPVNRSNIMARVSADDLMFEIDLLHNAGRELLTNSDKYEIKVNLLTHDESGLDAVVLSGFDVMSLLVWYNAVAFNAPVSLGSATAARNFMNTLPSEIIKMFSENRTKFLRLMKNSGLSFSPNNTTLAQAALDFTLFQGDLKLVAEERNVRGEDRKFLVPYQNTPSSKSFAGNSVRVQAQVGEQTEGATNRLVKDINHAERPGIFDIWAHAGMSVGEFKKQLDALRTGNDFTAESWDKSSDYSAYLAAVDQIRKLKNQEIMSNAQDPGNPAIENPPVTTLKNRLVNTPRHQYVAIDFETYEEVRKGKIVRVPYLMSIAWVDVDGQAHRYVGRPADKMFELIPKEATLVAHNMNFVHGVMEYLFGADGPLKDWADKSDWLAERKSLECSQYLHWALAQASDAGSVKLDYLSAKLQELGEGLYDTHDAIALRSRLRQRQEIAPEFQQTDKGIRDISIALPKGILLSVTETIEGGERNPLYNWEAPIEAAIVNGKVGIKYRLADDSVAAIFQPSINQKTELTSLQESVARYPTLAAFAEAMHKYAQDDAILGLDLFQAQVTAVQQLAQDNPELFETVLEGYQQLRDFKGSEKAPTGFADLEGRGRRQQVQEHDPEVSIAKFTQSILSREAHQQRFEQAIISKLPALTPTGILPSILSNHYLGPDMEASTELGSRVHKTMEAMFQGVGDEEGKKQFPEWDMVKPLFDKIKEEFKLKAKAGEEEAYEIFTEFNSGYAMLRGTADLILQHKGTEQISIIDYKTALSGASSKSVMSQLAQLEIYRRLLEQAGHEPGSISTWVLHYDLADANAIRLRERESLLASIPDSVFNGERPEHVLNAATDMAFYLASALGKQPQLSGTIEEANRILLRAKGGIDVDADSEMPNILFDLPEGGGDKYLPRSSKYLQDATRAFDQYRQMKEQHGISADRISAQLNEARTKMAEGIVSVFFEALTMHQAISADNQLPLRRWLDSVIPLMRARLEYPHDAKIGHTQAARDYGRVIGREMKERNELKKVLLSLAESPEARDQLRKAFNSFSSFMQLTYDLNRILHDNDSVANALHQARHARAVSELFVPGGSDIYNPAQVELRPAARFMGDEQWMRSMLVPFRHNHITDVIGDRRVERAFAKYFREASLMQQKYGLSDPGYLSEVYVNKDGDTSYARTGVDVRALGKHALTREEYAWLDLRSQGARTVAVSLGRGESDADAMNTAGLVIGKRVALMDHKVSRQLADGTHAETKTSLITRSEMAQITADTLSQLERSGTAEISHLVFLFGTLEKTLPKALADKVREKILDAVGDSWEKTMGLQSSERSRRAQEAFFFDALEEQGLLVRRKADLSEEASTWYANLSIPVGMIEDFVTSNKELMEKLEASGRTLTEIDMLTQAKDLVEFFRRLKAETRRLFGPMVSSPDFMKLFDLQGVVPFFRGTGAYALFRADEAREDPVGYNQQILAYQESFLQSKDGAPKLLSALSTSQGGRDSLKTRVQYLQVLTNNEEESTATTLEKIRKGHLNHLGFVGENSTTDHLAEVIYHLSVERLERRSIRDNVPVVIPSKLIEGGLDLSALVKALGGIAERYNLSVNLSSLSEKEAFTMHGFLPGKHTTVSLMQDWATRAAVAIKTSNAINSTLLMTDIEGNPLVLAKPGADDTDETLISNRVWERLARAWVSSSLHRGQHLSYDERLSGRENARRIYDIIQTHLGTKERGGYMNIDKGHIYRRITNTGYVSMPEMLVQLNRPLASDNSMLASMFTGGDLAGWVTQILNVPTEKETNSALRVLDWWNTRSKSVAMMTSFFHAIATGPESGVGAMGFLTGALGTTQIGTKALGALAQSEFGQKIGAVSEGEKSTVTGMDGLTEGKEVGGFRSVSDIVRLFHGESEYVADLMELMAATGVTLMQANSNPIDVNRRVLARDLDSVLSWAKNNGLNVSEKRVKQMHDILYAASDETLDWTFTYITNAMKMSVFSYIMAQQSMKAKAQGKWFDAVDTMRKWAPYINAEIGGLDPTMYSWATNRAQQLMRRMIFSWQWTMGAWEAGGGGALSKGITGFQLHPDVRSHIGPRWMRMYFGVMLGTSVLWNLVMNALGKVTGNMGDDDKWWAWNHEPGRKASFRLTPLMDAMAMIPGVKEIKSAPFHLGDLLVARTGDDPTDGNREYYMHFGKQGWEVARWFTDAPNNAFGKLSLPIQRMLTVLGLHPGEDYGLGFRAKAPLELLGSGDTYTYLAESLVPFSWMAIRNNPDAGILNMLGPIQKGTSRTQAVSQATKLLTTWVHRKDLRQMYSSPHKWNDLSLVATEWIRAAEYNGHDPKKLLKDAMTPVLQDSYRQLYNALPSQPEHTVNMEQLETAARELHRVNFVYQNMLKSMNDRDSRRVGKINVTFDVQAERDRAFRAAFWDPYGTRRRRKDTPPSTDIRHYRESIYAATGRQSQIRESDLPETVLGYPIITGDNLSDDDLSYFAYNPEAPGFFDYSHGGKGDGGSPLRANPGAEREDGLPHTLLGYRIATQDELSEEDLEAFSQNPGLDGLAGEDEPLPEFLLGYRIVPPEELDESDHEFFRTNPTVAGFHD